MLCVGPVEQSKQMGMFRIKSIIHDLCILGPKMSGVGDFWLETMVIQGPLNRWMLQLDLGNTTGGLETV